jgi:hypothetical protein
MASLVLNGSTSGSITISSPAVSGVNVLSLPANTGTVITTGSTFAGTGPAFSAYANGTQSLTSGTFTKITINTELFDTNSNFDSTTNYRFTPTVGGYYQVNGGVLISVGATGIAVASLYKNGSLATLGNSAAGDGTNNYSAISNLIYLNGSSDYVELYGLQNAGTSKSTIAGSAYTYFSASLVRSA